MSLLRKKKGSSKEMNINEPIRVRLGSSEMKSSLVSSVVQQLQDQGYKGRDLLSSSGMEYSIQNPAMESVSNEMGSLSNPEDRLLVDDIDFDASSDENHIKTKINAGEGISRKELLQRQRRVEEERTENSRKQIEFINKSSKKLYNNIDSFIKDLRIAADKARDNQVFCMKLERLRKICLTFARGMQSQMPGRTASLFVTPENFNEQKR